MKRNTFKELATCESLHELEADQGGGSRTAKASGMELLVGVVNSLYQWTIATKFSVLDVETVHPEHTGLDDKTFSFLKALFPKSVVSKIIS